MMKHAPLLAVSLATLCSGANAQLVSGSNASASFDRWMYPFNGSPGTRLELPAFGATLLEGFDDHDSQVLLGFDTSEVVPTDLGADNYRLVDVTVTLVVSNNNGFEYDESYDSYTTYGVLADPINDLDTGRPMGIYLIGYRNGLDQTTFMEFTAFGGVPAEPPANGSRNAFLAEFDAAGVATDRSNHIREGMEFEPLAVGLTDTVTPGDFVPADTVFTFTFSPCDLASGNEMARMLDLGELRFSVSSLNPASGGPDDGGGGEGNYPIFYSSENPIAQIFGYTPSIEYRVRVGDEGDFNGDGAKDFFDLSEFLVALSNGDPAADLDSNCNFDFFDLSAFLTAIAQ